MLSDINSSNPHFSIILGDFNRRSNNCWQTFCKINLKISYPPPYRRLVWDFKRANISSIRKAIKMVDWQFMFSNKNTHEQVAIFSDILMNIFPTNM